MCVCASKCKSYVTGISSNDPKKKSVHAWFVVGSSWADCIIGLKTCCKNWPGAAWLLLVAHIFASVQAAVTPWKGGCSQWKLRWIRKSWDLQNHWTMCLKTLESQVDKQGRLNMTSCHSCRGLAECLRPACLTNTGATCDISREGWFGPSEAHAKPTPFTGIVILAFGR